MKHNFVFLYGQVVNNPRIHRDNNTGEYIRGMCSINVIRGKRDYGDGSFSQLQYDIPIILSGNADIIKEMATWKEFDMVEIKGAITTQEVNKSTTCKCGHKNTAEGNLVFINPIYASRRETGITKEQGLALLKKRCEISNMVTVVGALCREPEVYTSPRGVTVTQYNLAIMRKFRIRENPAEERTDFPWVKSFGEIAEMDAKALKLHARVLVDGHLQAREVDRTTVCQKCLTGYQWQDRALEIVPYAVEYLQGHNSLKKETDEDKEEEQNISVADQILSAT